MMERASTLGELRSTGYRPRGIRDEIRHNLIDRLRSGRPLLEGVHGYDRTVVPALVNALLARHDIILLGLRGQAKTRILRSLRDFLDPAIPIVDGCEINDDPMAPVCTRCQSELAAAGDDLPISWLEPDDRYREKLATPDVTIADLIGDIDPIKAARDKRAFADPEVIHYGIIPRTNRGIFAVNELPDLAPRIQVGLLNLLEERDLQIRGFPVRIPLDVMMVFSANPEDYTNRGNIITPLKDRISSQILTHYPTSTELAVKITDQEAWVDRASEVRVHIPPRIAELVERITFAARASDLVDHSSGVSARMSISMREVLVSNLERRALLTGEQEVHPRLCDLWATLPAVTGKVEMVYEGEQQGAELVAKRIIGSALRDAFEEIFPPVPRPKSRRSHNDLDDDEPLFERATAGPDEVSPTGPYSRILAAFADDARVVLSDDSPFDEHERTLEAIDGLGPLVDGAATAADRFDRAFLMELVLEGLHQNARLSREDLDSTIAYTDALRFELLRRS